MTILHREANVPYTAEQMYNIVNDIPAYSEFLPWCSHSAILEKKAGEMLATIEVAAAGIHKAFTTRNRLCENESIEMQHVDGPFKSLTGTWRFINLEGDGCRVELEMEFEMEDHGLKSKLFSMFFNKAIDKLAEAFFERAKHLYGDGL